MTSSASAPTPAQRRLGHRRGMALVSAMLAMVAVSVLVAGLFVVVDLNAKAVKNREDASRAMHLAEAGAAHALGVLRSNLAGVPMTDLIRGNDGVAGTSVDGLLVGFGLLAAEEIPEAGRTFGGGTYYVKILDDPADGNGDPTTDSNQRVLVQCTGVTDAGASAEINVIVSNVILPGVAMDGNLEISGKLNIQGACGGAHVNGQLSGGGEPSAATQWSSTTGSIPSKFNGTKVTGATATEIPDLNPLDFCPSGAVHITNSLWKPGSAQLTAGNTYCVTGNVEIQGDFGSTSNMRQVTILASGSIKASGKPFLRAAHPDGIVLMAGGDLDIQGDSGFDGLLYCGGQVYISSKPTITGQLICKNKSPHPGSNWVSSNLISGDASITYGCGSFFGGSYRVVAWYPTIGN